jgi:hypothetical protein
MRASSTNVVAVIYHHNPEGPILAIGLGFRDMLILNDKHNWFCTKIMRLLLLFGCQIFLMEGRIQNGVGLIIDVIDHFIEV